MLNFPGSPSPSQISTGTYVVVLSWGEVGTQKRYCNTLEVSCISASPEAQDFAFFGRVLLVTS